MVNFPCLRPDLAPIFTGGTFLPNMKIGKLRIHISPHQSEIHGQEGDLNPGLLSESLCISMKYDHICSVCSFLTIMKVAHLKCHSKLIFSSIFCCRGAHTRDLKSNSWTGQLLESGKNQYISMKYDDIFCAPKISYKIIFWSIF